ncbi:hypothetical protein N9X53_08330, partial [Mariniblastus sp.]|nr:hypothetical protein [Mariniblastus sp.]
MSEQDSQDDNAESQTSSRRGLILILGVAVIAVAGGAAVPLFSPIDFSNFSKTTVAADESGANEEVDYIDFPEITVNLNEARHARFLRIHFSLQVPASQKKKIEKD